jgi:hypothetical protein
MSHRGFLIVVQKLTPHLERDFLRTLAALKSKDPKIYDPKVTFFEHEREYIILLHIFDAYSCKVYLFPVLLCVLRFTMDKFQVNPHSIAKSCNF